MEAVRNEAVPEIQFVIGKREANVLLNAGFVYLLQQRFEGEIYASSTYVEEKEAKGLSSDAFSRLCDVW